LTWDLRYSWRGELKQLTSPRTSSAHDTKLDKLYYLYSSDWINFNWSTTPFDYSNIQVAIAAYRTTYKFAIKETHKIMDYEAHKEFHNVIWTYRYSWWSLTDWTYQENTATDDATTPWFDEAIILDEDNKTTVPAWIQGTYTTIRIWATNNVIIDTTASFPFRSSWSYILINNPATWAETATTTGKYVNVYQILVPTTSDTESQKYRMLMLQPQVEYSSLASAQSEDPRSLSLWNLGSLTPEFTIYARITYVTSASDSNTWKCRIATGWISYITWSRQSLTTANWYIPSSHSNLTDRTVSDSHPATAISNIPAWNISATDIQTAINELDTEKQPTLVSWTNIKAINWTTLLWSWDITISWGWSNTVYTANLWWPLFTWLVQTFTVTASQTITWVRASVASLPTDANIWIDIRKNGTAVGNTIFGSPFILSTGTLATNW